MPALEDFGLNTKELLAEQNRETMGKLIAAEKTIERLRAALKAIGELRCEDLYYGPDADGVDNTAAALARAALNHEQSAPEKQEG